MPLITRNSQNANVKLGTTAQLAAITFTDGDLASDTTLNKVKVFNGVSLAEIGSTSFSSSAVVSQSTTIGNYTTPTAAVASSEVYAGASFTEDFSTYTTQASADAVWATNDTGRMRVNISTDVFDFTSVRNGINSTSNKTLSTTISDTSWVLKFRYNLTSNSGDARVFIGFSSTNGNYAATMDWLGCILSNSATIRWSFTDYDNAPLMIGAYTSLSYDTLVLGTSYYVKLSRTSATNLKLDVYSDSAYSVLLGTANRTILSTITGLGYLKICNMNEDTAGYTMTGIIDDIVLETNGTVANIFDNNTATKWTSSSESNPNVYVDMGSALNLCAAAFYFNSTDTTNTEILIQSSADASTWTTRRTITESNLTNGAYNYYRFNIAGGARYIRFYGNSAGSTVLSIWEIKILKKTDAEIFNDLGILTITASDTALGADGT